MAEYAKRKFGLTALVPNVAEFDNMKMETHPCSVDYSKSDPKTDALELMKQCQVHKCTGYCLRKATHEKE